MRDFTLYWSDPGVSSGTLSDSLYTIEVPYDSWGRFKNHIIKANQILLIQMEKCKSVIWFSPAHPEFSSGST